MRNYWIAFILVTLVGFGALGLIIYKSFIQKPKPELFILNVDSMKMAIGRVADSTDQRPAVFSIFPCDKRNAGDESIPWADLYLCRGYNKSDSLSGDTALVFIDIHTKSDLGKLENIDHYGVEAQMGQKFKRCRVMVPADQINRIRERKYKFASVRLVDEWTYD